MPTPTVPSRVRTLSDRTAYEASLLRTVYRFDDGPTEPASDSFIYSPNGTPPSVITVWGSGHSRLGDWRPGFLDEGKPLILVAAFKLFDMLAEWILDQNQHNQNFRFSEKIKALMQPGLVLPRPFTNAQWLFDRFSALYRHLEPLRGTIIHHHEFANSGEALRVASTKPEGVGMPVTLGPQSLRDLSFVGTTLARAAGCDLTPHLQKLVRQALDGLTEVHRLPSLNQLPPILLGVRVHARDEFPVRFDWSRIRGDLLKALPGCDPTYFVRIVLVRRDAQGCSARAFLVPETALGDATRANGALLRYSCALPTEVDAASLASGLEI